MLGIFKRDSSAPTRPRTNSDGPLLLSEGHSFRWEPINPSPQEPGGTVRVEEHCYYLTATVVGPLVFLIGRYGRKDLLDEDSSQLVIVDHTSRTWSWESVIGPYVTEHVAALKEDSIWVFGGRDANGLMNNEVWALDIVLREWSRLPVLNSAPPERAYCSGDMLESGDLVIFGGLIVAMNPRTYTNEVWVLNGRKLTWEKPDVKGNPPKARYGHASCSVGNKIFYYGGRDASDFFADLFILSLEKKISGSMIWTLVDVAGFTPRTGHSLNYVPGKLFLFGGFTQTQYVGDLEVFDLEQMRWLRDEAQTPDDYLVEDKQGRCSAHAAVVSQTKLLIFGGRFSEFKVYQELTATSTQVVRS